MESIISYLSSLEFDFLAFLKTGGSSLLLLLVVALIARFIFGKASTVCGAVSSAISILFIYALAVVIKSLGAELELLLAPLPLVSVNDSQLILFSFDGADYTAICSQLLSMVVLSFLVNLADRWIPKGKHILSWLFFRCLTVIIGFLLHLAAVWLFTNYLPAGIVTYAPAILLGILILMLLTGALKLIVGAVLTTVNPLIAAFYTFFFANIVGKQITKAVLTTLLLSGLVMLLNYLRCSVISIAAASLIAYIPFVILLVALWYLVKKFF